MRRYFQFSIRALFVLTTLSGFLCAFGSPLVKRYFELRERQKNLAASPDLDFRWSDFARFRGSSPQLSGMETIPKDSVEESD
jgi:hypothetical protein